MVWSLYIASLKEYTRDRMTLFWTLAFPVLFIVIFGLIFSGGGGSTYNVALINLDTGTSGQQLVAAFNSDGSEPLSRPAQAGQDRYGDRPATGPQPNDQHWAADECATLSG